MIRYHARWIVPIAAPPVRDGTLVEHRGGIVYVGARDQAPEGDDHELGEVILLPGLVNAHAHLDLSVMRGFLEDLPFGEWIRTLTRSRRAVLDRDALLDAARLSILEGLRAGITSYGDTSESGVALQAMGELGVRGVSYQEVFGPDPAECDIAMERLRTAVERNLEHETPRARLGISPHAPYSVSDALFAAAARYAVEQQRSMAIHIAESADEMRYVREGQGDFADSQRERGFPLGPRGRSPVAMLESAGALAARPLLIHAVRVDAEDIETIARTGCAVAHCPAANAKLGHGIAPVREMLDAGITVAIGSDSVASNNRMDVLEESRLATLMQRARLGSPDCLTAADALRMATLGGARALGIDAAVGTLEVGKAADCVAFPLAAAHVTPAFDPITTAVFSLAGRDAGFVMVGGEPRVVDGRLLGEPSGVRERVRSAAERLAAWRRSETREGARASSG